MATRGDTPNPPLLLFLKFCTLLSSCLFTLTSKILISAFAFILVFFMFYRKYKPGGRGRDGRVDLFGLHRLRHQAHGGGPAPGGVPELEPVRERRHDPVHGCGELVRVFVEAFWRT